MSILFGKNLRTYRMMAGLTQEYLAKSAGVTRNAIANYESGRSEPNFEQLCVFSRTLGVEVSDLITEHLEYPQYVHRMQVTDDESALLQAYRDADPVYRNVVLDILRSHKGVR